MAQRVRPMRRQRQPGITILDSLSDPHLFASHFKDAKSWQAWKCFLAVLFGLPLTKEQSKLFHECTGRSEAKADGYNEAWLVIGRRGGKSFTLALIAVYLATFREWKQFLGPGEVGTVMVIAQDRLQARVIMRYCKGLLQSVPMLRELIQGETRESITLHNRVVIEVHAASFRSTRGYSIIAALCDELAFWPTDDSAEPDYEVINAIRPGMATIPNSMLLCASSPYARRGALFDAHRRHFGHDGDPILCWQAPTRVMNPNVPQSVIDREMERDPAHATAEYLAQFRSDIESFVNRETVEACISSHVRERPPMRSVRYSAFVDPSGGSADSMTLAIGHRERTIAVVDAVREIKPPFSPESAVAEFCELLKGYRVGKVTGDRYAGEWPREQFKKHSVQYEPAAKAKSDLYVAFLPAINSRQVDLLDHPKLFTQLVGLERRTSRGGRDSIDHAPGQHDDVANAVAGLVAGFTLNKGTYDRSLAWVGDPAELRGISMHRNPWGAVGLLNRR